MKYLYNGVELPALPEWDKTAYPYAFIVSQGSIHLCISPNEPYIRESTSVLTGNLVHTLKFREDTTVKRWYANEAGEWEAVTDDDFDTSSVVPAPTWSNFDLLKEDGPLYLAASEPVPVTARNPAAMLAGFQLGTAIRRMRGMKQPEQPPVQTIVGYRYGDSPVLPEIPKVEGFDHAYLSDATSLYGSECYMMVLSDKPVYWLQGSETALGWYGDGTVIYQGAYVPGLEEHESGFELIGPREIADNELVTVSPTSAPLLWTSHDILNADGSTYLASSEPVPVYE